jgi:hypothetical protein
MEPRNIMKREMKFFEEQERTDHKDIPPAKDRIADFKRKQFTNFHPTEERPYSGVASSNGHDLTTQA